MGAETFGRLSIAIHRWRDERKVQQRKDARASRTLKYYRRKLLFLLQKRIITLRRVESVVSLGKSAVSLAGKPKKVQSRKVKSDIS